MIQMLASFSQTIAGAAPSVPPPSDVPPLTVDLEHLSVRISRTGKSYPLGSAEVARWLKILAQRPGVWVSSAELEAFDRALMGRRVERLRKQLPLSLTRIVESKRGKGARLRTV